MCVLIEFGFAPKPVSRSYSREAYTNGIFEHVEDPSRLHRRTGLGIGITCHEPYRSNLENPDRISTRPTFTSGGEAPDKSTFKLGCRLCLVSIPRHHLTYQSKRCISRRRPYRIFERRPQESARQFFEAHIHHLGIG